MVLFSEEPVEFVDLIEKSLDLLDMPLLEKSGIFSLQVFVFNFNVADLTAVELLQLQDLVPKSGIFSIKGLGLLLMSQLESLVISQLGFKLIVLEVVGCFEL